MKSEPIPGQLLLSWGPSCSSADTDYAIYEGTLGDFTSHTSLFCSTAGATTKTFTPLAGSAYYLVVPLSATLEGSYGTTSEDSERSVGDDACLPQQIGTCTVQQAVKRAKVFVTADMAGRSVICVLQ